MVFDTFGTDGVRGIKTFKSLAGKVRIRVAHRQACWSFLGFVPGGVFFTFFLQMCPFLILRPPIFPSQTA